MSASTLHAGHTTTDTAPDGPALHIVRAARPLPAADAVAAFIRHPDPATHGPVIGYALAPRTALWLRVHPDGTVHTATGGRDPLGDAYELVLFDGERELRWLRTPDGAGTAVAIGERPETLPPWTDVTPARPLRRGPAQRRLLAGTAAAGPTPGWTTLHGGRYATAHLPCPYTGGDILAIESAEYLVEDGHGNVDVADSRLVALHLDSRSTHTDRDEPERGTA